MIAILKPQIDDHLRQQIDPTVPEPQKPELRPEPEAQAATPAEQTPEPTPTPEPPLPTAPQEPLTFQPMRERFSVFGRNRNGLDY